MALRKEDGALFDWINKHTNRVVTSFGEDFEDPNIWISLLHGLLSHLGDYDPVCVHQICVYNCFSLMFVRAITTELMSTVIGP